MTRWNSGTVRHIPEEELHAYLDQALSRSQCVEIESHMAGCRQCAEVRDDTAALRDRTTALLARLGPGVLIPPPFEQVRDRFVQDRFRRRRWLTQTAWAASLLVALGIGMRVNHWVHGSAAQPAVTVAVQSPAPVAAVAPAVPVTTPAPSPNRSQPPRGQRRAVALHDPAASRVGTSAFQQNSDDSPDVMVANYLPPSDGPDQLSQEVFSVETQPTAPDAGLQGLWRSVGPDGLSTASSTPIPRVPGLPVVQVQVQPGDLGADVTAVDQQLEDGGLIRTLEGPVARVTSILADQEKAARDTAVNTPPSPASRDRMTLTLRQGDRMLAVTGPAKVLGSLMSRVNVRKRY